MQPQRREFLRHITTTSAGLFAGLTATLPSLAEAAPAKQQKDAGVQPDILVGQVAPFSGIQAHYGQSLAAGMRAAFAQVNRAGGVRGRQVRLLTADDQFDPARTQGAYEQLAQQGVVAFCSNFGTPTTLSVLPWISQHRIPVVGVYSGSQQIRNPVNPFIFNLRGSLQDEAGTIVRTLHEIGANHAAVIYESDAYGQAGLDAILSTSFRATTRAALPADATPAQAAALVSRVLSTTPQAVILVLTTRAAAHVIAALRARGFGSTLQPVVALSGVGPLALSRVLTPEQRGNVMVSTVTPFPFGGGGQAALTLDFRTQMAAANTPELVNFSSMEGFANAQVLLRALGTAKSTTPEAITAALNGLGAFSLGGTPGGLSFHIDAENHAGNHFVNLVWLRENGTYVNV